MGENRIQDAIQSFRGRRILVVGDIMLDCYTFGEVTRISPEAPIPVVRKISEKFALGGAGNVASNVASLGAKAMLCGVVGNDHNREILFDVLGKRGIAADAMFVHASKPTVVKHRIVSGDSHQLLRVDEEDAENLVPAEEDALFALAAKAMDNADVVIFSDYAKGLFSEGLTRRMIGEAKRKQKKIFADIKPQNKEYFVGVDLLCPNAKEAAEMAGGGGDIEGIGPKLVAYFGADLVVTRGGEGMSVFRRGGKAHHIPGKKIKVFDVSGAGDTVIAVLALAVASGLDLETAAALANNAGAIVVQKPGTATLTAEELLSSLRSESTVEGIGIVPKVWGYEKWIENNDKYCSKLLSLNKGYQCSLHYHKIKDETFLVTKGHVRFEKDGEVLHLREGGFVRIAPGVKHRFAGIEDSLIVEVSTYHDEADSYRIEESRKMDAVHDA